MDQEEALGLVQTVVQQQIADVLRLLQEQLGIDSEVILQHIAESGARFEQDDSAIPEDQRVVFRRAYEGLAELFRATEREPS